MTRTGIINQGSHQYLHWWQQQSTGLAQDLSKNVFPVAQYQSLPCVRGGGQAKACSEGLSIPQSKMDLMIHFCQLPAGNPVAALAVHRTAIHYRDCASLTLYTREPLGAAAPVR